MFAVTMAGLVALGVVVATAWQRLTDQMERERKRQERRAELAQLSGPWWDEFIADEWRWDA